MTTVTLGHCGVVYEVRAQGHATGSVETCAAVSCLLYTLAAWLANHKEIPQYTRLEDADAEIVMFGAECAAPFELLCAGFLSLQATSHEYIAVTITEEPED